MMAGINLFSGTFTLMSLLISGELSYSLAFVTVHTAALWQILVLSVSGAVGQIFIFYTIKKFGPLVFTIIMATRQLISTTLSAIIYGHHIGAGGLVGATIVFGAVGVQIWWDDRKSRVKAASDAAKAATAGAAGAGAASAVATATATAANATAAVAEDEEAGPSSSSSSNNNSNNNADDDHDQEDAKESTSLVKKVEAARVQV
jgi:hypothetical protein